MNTWQKLWSSTISILRRQWMRLSRSGQSISSSWLVFREERVSINFLLINFWFAFLKTKQFNNLNNETYRYKNTSLHYVQLPFRFPQFKNLTHQFWLKLYLVTGLSRHHFYFHPLSKFFSSRILKIVKLSKSAGEKVRKRWRETVTSTQSYQIVHVLSVGGHQ